MNGRHRTALDFPPLRIVMVASLFVLAVVGLYAPAIDAPFILDDKTNLPASGSIRTIDDVVRYALSGGAGPLGRPLALASFAVNDAMGAAPTHYRLVNLVIHALACILVGSFSTMLFRLAGMARPAFWGWWVAAVWAVHPLNVATVWYVVQRMACLSGFFVLLGLWAYLRWRVVPSNRSVSMLGLVVVSFVAATLSKENGVLLIPLAATIEICLLRGHGLDARNRALVFGGLALAIAAPATIFASKPEAFLAGYGWRPFSLVERLLTETRVLWYYLRLILWPDAGEMTLFHDGFRMSSGLFHPPQTLLALAAWVAAVSVALTIRRRQPLVALAVIWFLVAHALESSVLPLDLVFEHRNYLAMLGPLWLVAVLLDALSRHRVATFVAMAVIPMAVASQTFHRAMVLSDPSRMIAHDLKAHPESPRLRSLQGQTHFKRFQHSGDPADLSAAVAVWDGVARDDTTSIHELVALLSLQPEGDSRYAGWRALLLERVGEQVDLHDMKDIDRVMACSRYCPEDPTLADALIAAALDSNRIITRHRAELYNLKAIRAFRSGRREQARTALDQGLRLAPNSAVLRISSAQWFHSGGDCGAALAELPKTHGSLPDALHKQLLSLRRACNADGND